LFVFQKIDSNVIEMEENAIHSAKPYFSYSIYAGQTVKTEIAIIKPTRSLNILVISFFLSPSEHLTPEITGKMSEFIDFVRCISI